MRKCYLLCLAVLLNLFVAGTADAQETDDGFVSLFDGETFKGWYAADMSWWSIRTWLGVPTWGAAMRRMATVLLSTLGATST